MSVFDSSPLSNNGQKVPLSEVGKSSVISPESEIELIEMRGTYGYWVHRHGASIGEVRTAIKDGWWHFCVKGDILFEGKCFGNWMAQAKYRIVAYLNGQMRPQQVQLAQAKAGGQEVPCDVGKTAVLSPEELIESQKTIAACEELLDLLSELPEDVGFDE